MHRLSKKYISFLLAIMLIMAPFQNLMAASLSCAGMDDNAPHHMMNMVDIDRMPAVNNMTSDIEQNATMECCQDAGCALGHCVTTVATIYNAILIPTSPHIDNYVLPHVVHSSSQVFSPLFRPPIV